MVPTGPSSIPLMAATVDWRIDGSVIADLCVAVSGKLHSEGCAYDGDSERSTELQCLQICILSRYAPPMWNMTLTPCTNMLNTWWHLNTFQYAPICTNMQQCAAICTNMHQYAPKCTNMHQYVPICTIMHQYAAFCTNMVSCQYNTWQPYYVQYFQVRFPDPCIMYIVYAQLNCFLQMNTQTLVIFTATWIKTNHVCFQMLGISFAVSIFGHLQWGFQYVVKVVNP